MKDYRELFKLENEVPLLRIKENPEMYEIDLPICCSEVSNNRVVCVDTGALLFDAGVVLHGWCSGFDKSSMCSVMRKAPKCIKQFDEMENAGTDVTYRCIDCRSCMKCKNGLRFDALSIQDEIEQGFIERSMHIDVIWGITTAKLPFIMDGDVRLIPLKVYRGQVRKRSAIPEDKRAVIQFKQKLQALGFVEYVDIIDASDKEVILSSVVKYFIPW